MRKRYPLKFKILLAVFSIVSALVLIEILLAIVRPAPIFTKINILSRGAEYTLSPNRDLIYVPKPNAGENNSYGHRGNVFPFEPTGSFRIVFMGDSVVEGYRAKPEERFTEQLDARLGEGFEIVNLGVRGYNLLQEVEYFKEVGAKFSPKCVLWGITYNDMMLDSGEILKLDEEMTKVEQNGFYMQYYATRSTLDTIFLKSQIYRHIKYLSSSHSERSFNDSIDYELTDQQVANLLSELKTLSQRNGFQLYFVFLPVNTQWGAAHMVRLEFLMKDAGMEVVNLNNHPAIVKLGDDKKRLFFGGIDPCHFNPQGHKAVAQLMHQELEEGNRLRSPNSN